MLVPDWVCEVMSRSTEKLDRDEKLPYYAEHGVRHVWLVDPDKHLEVHSLDVETKRWREVRIPPRRRDGPREPFDAIELDLGALCRRRTPPEPSCGAARTAEPLLSVREAGLLTS
jgi:hypothetical protein